MRSSSVSSLVRNISQNNWIFVKHETVIDGNTELYPMKRINRWYDSHKTQRTLTFLSQSYLVRHHVWLLVLDFFLFSQRQKNYKRLSRCFKSSPFRYSLLFYCLLYLFFLIVLFVFTSYTLSSFYFFLLATTPSCFIFHFLLFFLFFLVTSLSLISCSSYAFHPIFLLLLHTHTLSLYIYIYLSIYLSLLFPCSFFSYVFYQSFLFSFPF